MKYFLVTISLTRDEEEQERVGVGVGDDVVEEDREVGRMLEEFYIRAEITL